MKEADSNNTEVVYDEEVSDRKVQIAWQLFVSLEYQVQVADRKVQAVFGLDAFLVAALSLQNQKSLRSLMNTGLDFSLTVDLILKACFLICVCIATWSAIQALTPRLSPQWTSVRSKKEQSFFYFGDIYGQSNMDYINGFITLSNATTIRQVLSQTQIVSKILYMKYKLLHRSAMFLSIALAVWILLEVHKFLN